MYVPWFETQLSAFHSLSWGGGVGKIGGCTVLHIEEKVAKVMELTKLAMESELFFQSKFLWSVQVTFSGQAGSSS